MKKATPKNWKSIWMTFWTLCNDASYTKKSSDNAKNTCCRQLFEGLPRQTHKQRAQRLITSGSICYPCVGHGHKNEMKMENRRKLYRTSTDKWLGGVLGGIAAYLVGSGLTTHRLFILNAMQCSLSRDNGLYHFVDLHASRRRNRQLGKDERTKHVIF